jgi:hypothetical protein
MASKDVVHCLFGRQAYSEGSTVCAMLSGTIADIEVSSVVVQAYGHVYVDQRWIKTAGKLTDVFLQSAGVALQENVRSPNLGPLSPNIQAVCIFISQQEPCSVLDFTKGIFVQFELW